MCLLRCSACFGPHSFAHSCPVDPASARPSSNKIILYTLPRARALTQNMNAYIITSSLFCGFPTFWGSWLDFDRFRQKYQRILLHTQLWNRFLHPCPHKSSHRACTKNIQHLTSNIWNISICWGLDANRGSISISPLFRVSLTSETEIPVSEMEASREQAEWLLQVCVKGQPRASVALLLLEGQPECGIKAFISSHSLCVLFQQIFQTHTLRLFHNRVKTTKTLLI